VHKKIREMLPLPAAFRGTPVPDRLPHFPHLREFLHSLRFGFEEFAFPPFGCI